RRSRGRPRTRSRRRRLCRPSERGFFALTRFALLERAACRRGWAWLCGDQGSEGQMAADKLYVVTGGAGFIGSNVAAALAGRGERGLGVGWLGGGDKGEKRGAL